MFADDNASVCFYDFERVLSVIAKFRDQLKSVTLHIGSRLVSYQYSMGHDVISHETQCKDLGVVITNSLSFTQHICECTTKAHRRANVFCV